MKPIPDMTREELAQALWQAKLLIRHLGQMIDRDEANMVRAGGGATCSKCGLEYFDHPEIHGSTLRIICDGSVVHL
jgi:hypothetical protein